MTVGAILHPALLWFGAAAAAVPIVIHLLSRRRVRPRAWAAMRWLLAALKRHQRRLRMENWLVLLLRVAALALLGLGLSRWILSDSSLASLLRPKRSVILLLDTSYSTGAKDGARSVSDRVRAEADRVLSGLSKDDTLVVIVSNDVRPDRSGTQPHVLVPRTVGAEGVRKAKEALGLVRPTEAPASWGDALATAASRTVLQPEDVNRVLVWITDLQARDWKKPLGGAADPLAKGIRAVHAMPCPIRIVDASGGRAGAGGKVLPNLAVEDVRAGAGDLFEQQKLRLVVAVRNHGPDPVEGASLRIHLDDQPSPVRVVPVDRLPPADPNTLEPGRQEVQVLLPREAAFQTPGPHAVRVEVAPRDADAASDALGLDSRRLLALSVRAKLKVAGWTEPTAGAQGGVGPAAVLRGVYVGEGKGDAFELRTFSTESQFFDQLEDPTWEPDLAVFANTAPRTAERARELAAFVRAGGALLVFPGDRVDPAEWNGPFHAPGAGANGNAVARLLPLRYGTRELPPPERSEARAFRLDFETATAHPLSRRFANFPTEFRQSLRRTTALYGRTPILDERPAPPGMTPAPGGAREDDDTVIFRFEGAGAAPGTVAAVEGRLGQGRAAFCAFAIDEGWTQDAMFVPIFLNAAALELTRRDATMRSLAVGQPILAPIPRDATAPRLQVPGRGEITPATRAPESETDRPTIVHERVGASGLWRLSYQRQAARTGAGPGRRVEEYFAVNPDPAEGSLRRAEIRDVEQRVPGADLRVFASYEEEGAAVEDVRQGELSTYVLFAVLALLLLESFLAMKFGRHDRPEAAPRGEAPPPDSAGRG